MPNLAYLSSSMLGSLRLPQLGSNEATLVAAVILLAGGLSFLFFYLVRGLAADRAVVRVMVSAIVVAFAPGLVLTLGFWLIGESARAGPTAALAALALPLLPGLYAVAICRNRLGRWEPLAIQVLTLYSFAVLYAAGFALAYGILTRFLPYFSSSLASSLSLSLLFVLGAPPIYVLFRKLADRVLYGARYQPEQVLRRFASQLSTATTWKALGDLVEKEVAGPLLVRQSAVLLLSEASAEMVYQSGVADWERLLEKDEIRRLADSAGDHRRPPESESPSSWIRLALPIPGAGQTIGLWLFGHRDPDNWYPQRDIRLLSTLSNELGVLLQTLRLVDESRRRAEESKALSDAGLALNSLLDPRQQVQLLAQSAMRALEADEVEFFRHDPASGVLEAETVLGIDPTYAAQWKDLKLPERAESSPPGWVASRREPLCLPDVRSFAGWVPLDPGLHSGIWAPVEREGRLLGVLGAMRNASAAFSGPEADLLSLLANQAAVAMENARLFQQTELRLQRMSSSRSIDTAITGSLDLRVTLNVLLDQVTTQLGMDAADVLLFNTHTQLLEFAAARGFRSRALQSTRLQVGKGLAGRAALDREIVHLSDLVGQSGELSRSPLLASEDFVEYYGVPLVAKAQIKGVLEVFSRRPIEPDPEWLEFLETIAGQAAIAVDNASLFDSLQRTNVDLTLAFDSTLESLARALDLRNHEPEGHTLRATELTLQISRVLGLGEADLVHLRRGALLHDLGHLGVPEAVLLKAGPLNEREWGLIRRHPALAFELLSPIEFLRPALDIPYCHHEKWDGTGYPRGLVGEQIPIGARIFAVVDVWESLTSDRPFREAWSQEQARKHVWDKARTHFDPAVVEIFLESVSRT